MARTRTITELQAELTRKRGRLRTLRAQRNRLAKQLGQVDRQLAQLRGTAAGGRSSGRKRRRARNTRSLADTLAAVLAGAGGVKVADAARLARQAGYRTASRNFGNIVGQTLAGDKRFSKVSRGVYALKSASGSRTAKPKKKATAKSARKRGKKASKTSARSRRKKASKPAAKKTSRKATKKAAKKAAKKKTPSRKGSGGKSIHTKAKKAKKAS